MTTTGAQQTADQAAELLQNLSLDSQTKGLELPEPTKKPSTNQCGSVDSSNATNDQFQPYERSLTPLLQEFLDPAALCYLPNGYPSTAYYYGAGFDGTANGWDEFPRFVSQDGVEMTPGVYGDNGSLMYQHGYEYGPYAPYSPGAPDATLGHDGQLYAPQHYHYPTQYFQHANPTIDLYSSCPTAPLKVEVATSTPAEQTPLSVETANGNSNVVASGGVLKGNNGSAAVKATNQINSNGSYAKGALTVSLPASGYLDPRFCFDGIRCPIPWLDGVYFPDGQPRQMTNTPLSHSISNFNSTSSKNQNICPHSNLMGLPHPRPLPGISATPGYINRMHPNKMYGQYGNAFRSAYGLPSTGYDSRINDRGWMSADNKYRPRGRANGCSGYGNENMSGLNELTRGPRAKGLKNQKGQNGVLCATTDEEDKLSVDREQYNHADFCEKYTDAKFFIIKSYSEDDVHKSIKYNVWASTPNGNKKLDAAYQEALQKSGGCPVFLFFSVNASGQFVGVAEMVGPVDFNKNVEYWQQDKWNGCFSVKWHIVKDVPNNLLKHITLENNENKPVTNSRDTQEVKIEQGLHLIKIFKDYSSKTCILDDFGFYENREKVIQEKKTKQQQFIKQVWEGKPTDEKNKGLNGEFKSPEKTEVLVDFLQDSAVALQANGERKEPSENSNIPKTNDVPKSAKSVFCEKKAVSNGVADGC